jgi:hypothetical protein
LKPRQSRSRTALLLIDFFNPLDFNGGAKLAPYGVRAIRATRAHRSNT